MYDNILDHNICTEVPGIYKGICQGDSGGPLVVKTGKWFTLIAVVSNGVADCKAVGSPGVYGRVSSILEWIGNNTSGLKCSK